MKQTKFRIAATPTEVSDLEIATAVFAACPDVQNLKIIRDMGESPFVFTFTDGGSVTGTPTRVMQDVVEIRQPDGQLMLIVKSAVAAVRRPDCFPITRVNRLIRRRIPGAPKFSSMRSWKPLAGRICKVFGSQL